MEDACWWNHHYFLERRFLISAVSRKIMCKQSMKNAEDQDFTPQLECIISMCGSRGNPQNIPYTSCSIIHHQEKTNSQKYNRFSHCNDLMSTDQMQKEQQRHTSDISNSHIRNLSLSRRVLFPCKTK